MNAIVRAFIFTTWLAFNFVPRGQVSAEVTEQPKLKFVVLGDIGGIPRKPYSLWTQELVSKQVAMVGTYMLYRLLYYIYCILTVEASRLLIKKRDTPLAGMTEVTKCYLRQTVRSFFIHLVRVFEPQ